METKICTKCKRELPIDQFNWRNKSKGTRRSECKFCHSEYMKQRYQSKKEIIQDLKSKCACAKCGDTRGYVLDYHHIDPSIKEEGIARMTSNNYNLEKVFTEIEKCAVLCSNCHRELHYLMQKNKDFTLEDYLKNNY